ncbi:MAG: iron-siderophore ABC transporter substrate-binding protein [Acidimicrobiales bacterium]
MKSPIALHTGCPSNAQPQRVRRMLVLAAAATVLVAACGNGGTAPTDPASPAPDATRDTDGSQDPASGEFPVTVDHKFGSTTIDAEPERIVALGYTELDYVLALGYQPVAARYPQFGDTDTAVRAWAEDAADGAAPEVLDFAFGELGFEAIAALDPDLILAVTSGITPDEYATLAEIAPTVAQTDEFVDFGMPWEDITRHIGAALGRPDLADELVGDVEARFATASDLHPEFAGRTLVSAFYGGSEILAFASEDLRARFFTSLGFAVLDEIDRIAGESFFATLSLEQAELVDTDVLVWSQLQFTDGGRDAIEADPVVSGLDATREGRTVFIGGDVDDAYQVSSILSLPAALDGIVPMLERATDGDPSTVPSPSG